MSHVVPVLVSTGINIAHMIYFGQGKWLFGTSIGDFVAQIFSFRSYDGRSSCLHVMLGALVPKVHSVVSNVNF